MLYLFIFQNGLKPFEGTFKDAMIRFNIDHTDDEHSAIDKARKMGIIAVCLEKQGKPMKQPKAHANY